MSDIAASERRLAAALDRIDYVLENAPLRSEDPAVSTAEDSALQAQLAEARSENARLAADLQALHDAQGQAMEQSLSDAGDRLTGAGREAARLAAANEELAAANRALIAAQGGDAATATQAALNAEIESLRAARAAEIAQMGDIMAELERLLGSGEPGSPRSAEPASDESGSPEEPMAQGDATGVAAASDDTGHELTREPDPAFDAVYGDAPDGDFDAGDDEAARETRGNQ
ncbi:hypothetical protein MLD63_05020 [Paracoccus sp. TK19116]|uniref:Uncharacterized protein n=1 Tax=Paracoccus albicereus TaxID=2922394 RepID=A0ABT1MNW0_9RHOB|nr:hypothetical protein [Paracoccus albicereus]MCQ0969789.1 hypothetical protein [Paracoccus albicereus]